MLSDGNEIWNRIGEIHLLFGFFACACVCVCVWLVFLSMFVSTEATTARLTVTGTPDFVAPQAPQQIRQREEQKKRKKTADTFQIGLKLNGDDATQNCLFHLRHFRYLILFRVEAMRIRTQMCSTSSMHERGLNGIDLVENWMCIFHTVQYTKQCLYCNMFGKYINVCE